MISRALKFYEMSWRHNNTILTKIFLRYEAGDHLAIYPTNDTEAVNSLGKILNVDLDEIFSLQNIDGKLTNKLKKTTEIQNDWTDFILDGWKCTIIEIGMTH